MKKMKLSFWLILLTTIALVILVTYKLKRKPKYYFSLPTGQHAVGTSEYYFVDKNRNRKLMVQAWYPAQGYKENNLMPYYKNSLKYWYEELTPELDEKEKPLLKELENLYTYCKKDAPFLTGTKIFPLVIFAHGFDCVRTDYSAYCQNLASHGYIVISTDHTDSAYYVKFPDGSESRVVTPKSFKEKVNRSEDVVQDVQFVLTKLDTLPLAQHIDKKNIGMFGHSLGGVATMKMLRDNPQIKSGISLDGPIFSKAAVKGFKKAFMFIIAQDYAEMSSKEEKEEFDLEGVTKKDFENFPKQLCKNIAKQNCNAYLIKTTHTKHMDFSDYTIIKEVLKQVYNDDGNLGMGPIDGYKVTKIINKYIVKFFNKTLKMKKEPILNTKNPLDKDFEFKKFHKTLV